MAVDIIARGMGATALKKAEEAMAETTGSATVYSGIDTPSIDIDIDNENAEIEARVRISVEDGNGLSLESDGLYVPYVDYYGTESESIETIVDHDTGEVTSAIILSSNTGNALTVDDSGLFVKQYSNTVDPKQNVYIVGDNGLSFTPPEDSETYRINKNVEKCFTFNPPTTGRINSKNTYSFYAYMKNLSFKGTYNFEITWSVTISGAKTLIAQANRKFENFYVQSDVLDTPLVNQLGDELEYPIDAVFELSILMTSGSNNINIVSSPTNPVTLIRNGDFTISTNSIYGVNESGDPATQKEINEEFRDNFTSVYQSVLNTTTSIESANDDLSALDAQVNGELDEIDEQINSINDELDDLQLDVEETATDIVELNSKVEMYKQKVVRDGDTTFLAVDNTDYQWSTSQDDLVVTLPTPTDLTRTHIINLNFIAGSNNPITLFGDYNTPIDWTFVSGCLYQIQFKYIEADWEIKVYCPEREFVQLDDAVVKPQYTTLSDINIQINTLSGNQYYQCTSPVISLIISDCDQTWKTQESIIYMTTGTMIVTNIGDIKIANGAELVANKSYMLKIQNKIMQVFEVDTN